MSESIVNKNLSLSQGLGATAVVLIIAFIFLFFSQTNIGSGSDPNNAMPKSIIFDGEVSKLFNIKCEPDKFRDKYRSDAMECLFENISGINLSGFTIKARSYDQDGVRVDNPTVISRADKFMIGESSRQYVNIGGLSRQMYDDPISKVVFYLEE